MWFHKYDTAYTIYPSKHRQKRVINYCHTDEEELDWEGSVQHWTALECTGKLFTIGHFLLKPI